MECQARHESADALEYEPGIGLGTCHERKQHEPYEGETEGKSARPLCSAVQPARASGRHDPDSLRLGDEQLRQPPVKDARIDLEINQLFVGHHNDVSNPWKMAQAVRDAYCIGADTK